MVGDMQRRAVDRPVEIRGRPETEIRREGERSRYDTGRWEGRDLMSTRMVPGPMGWIQRPQYPQYPQYPQNMRGTGPWGGQAGQAEGSDRRPEGRMEWLDQQQRLTRRGDDGTGYESGGW